MIAPIFPLLHARNYLIHVYFQHLCFLFTSVFVLNHRCNYFYPFCNSTFTCIQIVQYTYPTKTFTKENKICSLLLNRCTKWMWKFNHLIRWEQILEQMRFVSKNKSNRIISFFFISTGYFCFIQWENSHQSAFWSFQQIYLNKDLPQNHHTAIIICVAITKNHYILFRRSKQKKPTFFI